ncbi:MAG: protein phosphatase 2C domain-containing protein [Rubripirellula sp.]|nr:protein phosphatase 2C domain-containing protein [Rubripirellula sp.]
MRSFPEVTLDDVEQYESAYVELAALTHPGVIRTNNEDQYAIIRRSRQSEVLARSFSLGEQEIQEENVEAFWLMVADGLGGQVSGEIASETAIRAVMKYASELSSWVMRPLGELRSELETRLQLYGNAISQAMCRQVEENPELSGMATTLTSVYLFGNQAAILNVGDSRSYLYRNCELQQLTEDHTLSQQLQQQGLSERMADAYRNVVTRCFDTSGKSTSFDLFLVTLEQEDQLLLCSDGLSDMVQDAEICQLFRRDDPLPHTARNLVNTALRNGGQDNVTAVLARMCELGEFKKFETTASSG